MRRSLDGEARFDRFTRGLYAADASIYRADPLGVVIPRSVRDVETVVQIAGDYDTSVVPRGAGTSQSGQSIGRGLVVDTSRHLSRVLDFDPAGRRVVVEPGVVLDRLNAFLRPHGLFFPIDVATSSRATLGGMAGNNSAGSRSIRYGHMVEHVRGLEAVLADGRRVSFGELGPTGASSGNGGRVASAPPPTADLVGALHALYEREAEELERRLPKVSRHVAGYALQRLARADAPLSDLLVGSEGTLAFFTALDLELQELPAARALAVCSFDSTRAALSAVPEMVALAPTAVELVDRTLLRLAGDIATFRPVLERLGAAERLGSEELMIVEFAGPDPDAIARDLAAFEDAMAGPDRRIVRAETDDFQSQVWGLRKAGLNIFMSTKAARKPVAFIEDCAIPLARLPEWYDGLTRIMEHHETHAVWYAHASVGCLHVRPALDLRDGEDVWRLRAIAEQTFALAGELGGSHSAEHGDGWVRSEFLEPMLGSRLVRAFEEIKRRFDPDGRLNPGKIVDPPRMDDRALLRHQRPQPKRRLPTKLDWSAWDGFEGAVDMCNNNGTCRKRDAGVMCPSFRATEEERDATRGRANALRLALAGDLGDGGWDAPELYRAMDLCIGCKACKRECPTGVDMARMKLEYLARYRARHPLTARERALAYLPRLAPWAARVGPLLNLRNRSASLARLGERFAGLAAERRLPSWASPFRPEAAVRRALSSPSRDRGEVAVFVDTFSRYFEPENAYAAFRVLRAAGYRPTSLKAGRRPPCCGRTFLNVGLLDEARAELSRTARACGAALARGVPIVGIEPSCLLTLRDELPALLPGPESESIAGNAVLLGELLVRDGALDDVPLTPVTVERVLVHGHCHEKAFGIADTTAQALGHIPDLEIETIPSGCCGMAGSFGYESEHFDISKRIAELELLPAVREMGEDEWLVANGTSCRHQVADLADAEGRHLARVLESALAESGARSR
ncbi:MAG: FAD-binding protein [Gemmatimonadetes bacterium]|nr:FAD-binding protein [Gemmatimonadota bacterium]